MISVICPVYNEVDNIEHIIKFFTEAKPNEKELLIIDGGSTDGTREIVREWTKRDNSIILVENHKRYVPFGLNKAIKLSKGNIIIRLDGHSKYAQDYFEKVLETFKNTDADVVGGPINAIGKTPVQKAVAYATATVFGTGNSKIYDIKFKGYTDHVYLGAWRKELFREVGNFDERLKVNHDDDFSYRIRSKGKTIFINPEIKSFYFPRSNFTNLIKQYFMYGYEKPIVNLNVIRKIKLRHVIPSFFLVYVLFIPLYFSIPLMFMPLVSYLLMDFYFAFIRCKLQFRLRMVVLIVYPAIHLAYGLGYVAGLKHIFWIKLGK
jgi:glycosyltransferase involved in cell wall biosynthesis